MSEDNQATPTPRAEAPFFRADDVVNAVRISLEAEVRRVADPRPIPEDHAGWRPWSERDPGAPGHPSFDPAAWRWFSPVDVAYVDRLVVVAFRWTDPATPELTYVTVVHADTSTVSGAASVVRSALRALLAPGWRERVDRSWLDRKRVLISPPRRVVPALNALREDEWRSSRALDHSDD